VDLCYKETNCIITRNLRFIEEFVLDETTGYYSNMYGVNLPR